MLFRIFIFLFPVCSFCQSQFRFEHFTIKNGLSQNSVHCVLKDKEGYYWIGTQDGLNKYDGYSVKIFRHDKSDSTSISDNFILTLLEDNFGNLWVGTRNGLNHYDKRKGVFTKIISNEKEKKNFHASVWNVFIDNEGSILFSNFYFQLVKIVKDDSKAAPFFPQIVGSNAILFNSSAKTYCVRDSGETEITSFSSDHVRRWGIKDSLYKIQAILETEKGKTIIGTNHGLFLVEEISQKLSAIQILSDKAVNKLLYDTRHNIWVGTSIGLYVFTNANLSAAPTLLTHSSEDMHSLAGKNIQELYEDSEGLIWAGTAGEGVSIYDPQKNIFKIFNHTSSVPLSANSVSGIYQNKKELWLGTSSGLNHLIFENESICGLYNYKNKVVRSEVFRHTSSSENSICSNHITAITKDKNGNFWFGSSDNGISIYDPVSKQWKQINTKNSPLKSDVIFHLMSASDGKIWISTMGGFFSYDPASDHFQSFLSTTYEKDGFPIGYIICTFEDVDKTIWAGSTLGAYHIKNNGERIAIYDNRTGDDKSLSYNMVTSFLRDSKKRLWIGTLGGGINIFDDHSKVFRSYQKKDGLTNNVVYTILEDKNGKLWITTNGGISSFDPEKKSFENYSEKDGIVANEFSQNAGLVNGSGELLFGSPEGLVVFNPGEIEHATNALPVIISSLKINYNPVSYSSGNPIDLVYRDKTVTFEFTSPDFRSQEKIHYAFQMEGFDNEWHDVQSSNRFASYTNLPFGTYVFKVRVRKGNGSWQQRIASANVNVIAPFWLQKWFILIELILTLAAVVFLVRYYSQRKLRQRLRVIEMQQKVHLERERISRDLHDNVGSHLTYIITSLDTISHKMEKGEGNISTDKIISLSDFSRDTMQQLRESIWAINKETVSLTELKDKIKEYSSRMASAISMGFDMKFSGNESNTLKPSHAINIYRVVQEAVNNSVKHSEAQSLSVAINKNADEYISIEVTDNGKGMKVTSNDNGYGLKNMQDRVKDLGGEISIDSNERGTKISFSIPI